MLRGIEACHRCDIPCVNVCMCECVCKSPHDSCTCLGTRIVRCTRPWASALHSPAHLCAVPMLVLTGVATRANPDSKTTPVLLTWPERC
jgi:hypothetical protein